MIRGKSAPLGVICNIYYTRHAPCALKAPWRLWLLCALYGFWTSRYEADSRKVPTCTFTSSWLMGRTVCCAAQGPRLWSGAMHYGTVQLYTQAHTRARTHAPTLLISSTGSSGHIQPQRTPRSLVRDLKWNAYCSVVRGCVFVLVLACLHH